MFYNISCCAVGYCWAAETNWRRQSSRAIEELYSNLSGLRGDFFRDSNIYCEFVSVETEILVAHLSYMYM